MNVSSFGFVILGLLQGCVSDGVLELSSGSESANGAIVRIQDLNKDTEESSILGVLPQTLDINELLGKKITVEKDGFQTESYIFLPELGSANTLSINLKQRKGTEGLLGLPDQKLVGASLLTLKAYQALSNDQFQTAIDIAKKSQEMMETGPGPTIIEAIALWRLGDTKQASERLKVSKTVYPQISEIDTLLKAIESQQGLK